METTALEFEGKKIRTTLSLGVASMVPLKGYEKEQLLARADTCLYRAKNGGRNGVEWDL